MISSIDFFIREFGFWVQERNDVIAAALVGSYARGQARKDSDIDLLLLVEAPKVFFDDTRWLWRFGVPVEEQMEDYGKVTSLRVWFSDGREVEFGFSTPDWAAPPLDEGSNKVIHDGMKVLYEKDHLLSQWQ
jgi:hypothetical protein